MKSIIFILLITLSGCANTGERFNIANLSKAPEDQALVYFYRTFHFCGGGMSFRVIANDMEIGRIHSSTYFKRTLPPGNYKIHSRCTNVIDRISRVVFNSGEVYFIRCFIDQGMWVSSTRFSLVHKNVALREMKKTKVLIDQ